MNAPAARLDGRRVIIPYDRPVTAQEWDGIAWPSCPECGATIRVERVDVTAFSQELAHYVAGRAECPNECDPAAPR